MLNSMHCDADMPQDSLTSGRPAWCAQATLTYQRQGNKTIPQAQTQAPLKVQRPFYPEGPGICHSVLLHTAGGMVGGDRLHYTVQLAPHTHALITTAAAAKIYDDRPHQRPAQVTGKIQVAAGAHLEWLPQEAIVFAGAHYHSHWQVQLEPGATWLGWDIQRLGRTARGESFLAGEVRSRLEVWQGDRPLWIDPQWLPGNDTTWHSPHALKGCPVVATLAYLGEVPNDTFLTAIRDYGHTLTAASAQIGVTRLQQGILCRYRGTQTAQVRRWFTAVWQQLRQETRGQAAVPPRVWQR